MKYEPINTKQVWLLVALGFVVWIPETVFICMECSGVLRLSARQMAAIGAVNMIIGVGTLIVVYRKWISKIKG